MNTDIYRFKLADFQCIAVSDGIHTHASPTFPPPAIFLSTNAPRERLEQTLREHNLYPEKWAEWVSPYIRLVINAGEHRVLVADSTGVKTGKTKRGSSLNLAIKVTGREVKGNRAMLKKELVTLSVGKWREDELKGVNADLGITDGEPEVKGVIARTQPALPSQRCLFHVPRDLYWALYRDGAQGEWAYWQERLKQEL